MAEIRHLENRHDIIFFCREWSDLDKISQTGTEWHVDCGDVWKWKPDVEFQYGGRLGEFNGMSSQSYVSHCRVGEFTVTISEPHATLPVAVTWPNLSRLRCPSGPVLSSPRRSLPVLASRSPPTLLLVRLLTGPDVSDTSTSAARSWSSERPTCNFFGVVCESEGYLLQPPSLSPSSPWLLGRVVVCLSIAVRHCFGWLSMFRLIIIRMYDSVLFCFVNYYLMCGSKTGEELNNKWRKFNQHTAVQFYIQINSDTRQVYSKQRSETSITHKSMAI